MNATSSISNIENYLDEFLYNCKRITQVCEDILDLKPVKGLDKYSKELLALTLEKKIIRTIEQFHIDKQKSSFWRDTKLIAPITYQENNFLKNYVYLFAHHFLKSSKSNNLVLNEIDNFYDEIIEQASKEFRNKLFTLPNNERVSVGDLQIAVYNTLNIPVSKTLTIKEKTGNLKSAFAIAGLATTLAAAAISYGNKTPDEPIYESKKTITVETPIILPETTEIPVYKNVLIGYDNACEYQEYIKKMCDEYDVPFNVMMTIIDNESDGKFDSNGKISDWGDYGYCQINECNHDVIYEVLGITPDELLNNPEKNIEAAVYLVSEICKKYPQEVALEDYTNVFGTYNGWVLWKEKQTSIEYVEKAMKKMENTYNKTDEELFERVCEVSDAKTR